MEGKVRLVANGAMLVRIRCDAFGTEFLHCNDQALIQGDILNTSLSETVPILFTYSRRVGKSSGVSKITPSETNQLAIKRSHYVSRFK